MITPISLVILDRLYVIANTDVGVNGSQAKAEAFENVGLI
jgi:hypothetical protein